MAVITVPTTFELKPQLEHNVQPLAVSDTLTVLEHIWEVGAGEVELHCHHLSDASWLVTAGNVTFYDENNAVIATLGKDQGLFMPRDVKYRFENSGNEPLIMVRTSSRSKPVGPGMIDRDPPLAARLK